MQTQTTTQEATIETVLNAFGFDTLKQLFAYAEMLKAVKIGLVEPAELLSEAFRVYQETPERLEGKTAKQRRGILRDYAKSEYDKHTGRTHRTSEETVSRKVQLTEIVVDSLASSYVPDALGFIAEDTLKEARKNLTPQQAQLFDYCVENRGFGELLGFNTRQARLEWLDALPIDLQLSEASFYRVLAALHDTTGRNLGLRRTNRSANRGNSASGYRVASR